MRHDTSTQRQAAPRQKKPLALLLILSTLSIAILSIYTVSVNPIYKPLSEISPMDVNRYIATEGYVKHSKSSAERVSIKIIEIQSNKTLWVFTKREYITANVQILQNGSLIKVQGVVETFADGLSITISNKNDIQLIKRAGTDIFSIRELLRNTLTFENMYVKTSGFLERTSLLKTENGTLVGIGFTLKNYTESEIYRLEGLLLNHAKLNITIGNEIHVSGLFQYYENNGVWEIVSTNPDEFKNPNN